MPGLESPATGTLVAAAAATGIPVPRRSISSGAAAARRSSLSRRAAPATPAPAALAAAEDDASSDDDASPSAATATLSSPAAAYIPGMPLGSFPPMPAVPFAQTPEVAEMMKLAEAAGEDGKSPRAYAMMMNHLAFMESTGGSVMVAAGADAAAAAPASPTDEDDGEDGDDDDDDGNATALTYTALSTTSQAHGLAAGNEGPSRRDSGLGRRQAQGYDLARREHRSTPIPNLPRLHFLVAWLNSLQITPRPTTPMTLAADLSSGVVLCRLAEKLVPGRKLGGRVDANPRSNAPKAKNIEMAYQLLLNGASLTAQRVPNASKILSAQSTAAATLLNEVAFK